MIKLTDILSELEINKPNKPRLTKKGIDLAEKSNKLDELLTFFGVDTSETQELMPYTNAFKYGISTFLREIQTKYSGKCSVEEWRNLVIKDIGLYDGIEDYMNEQENDEMYYHLIELGFLK